MLDDKSGRPAGAGGPQNMQELESFARLAGDSALNLLRLAKAELLLTLAEIPHLLILCLVLIPFILFAWLSFSVLLAWFAYAASGEVAIGIFVFFLLQGVPSLLLVLRIARIESSLFFPETSRQLKKLSAFLKSDAGGMSGR